MKYIVLSPDATAAEASQQTVGGIIEMLLDAGISPALGHFRRTDPEASAEAIRDVFRIMRRRATGDRCPMLLSDHLFNDMPRRIPHAWRTSDERARRQTELDGMNIDEWRIENVSDRLGAVPGALIRGAHDGLITLCINFDGQHLDIEIARRVVQVVGADNIIALTDRVDGTVLAGQNLLRSTENRLLYREDGVVVAGSIALDEQMENMRGVGISEEEIWKMVSINPHRALGLEPDLDMQGRPLSGSFVDASRSRDIFDARGKFGGIAEAERQ